MDIKKTLFDLCAISGVSGYESGVSKYACELLRPYCDTTETTPLNNAVGVRSCGVPDAPRILLDAHLDQIGFIVSGYEKGGFVRFTQSGGFDPRLLCAKEVYADTDDGERFYGIITAMPPHVQSADERDKAVPISDMLIDFGMADDVLKERIKIGTPVCLAAPHFELKNGFIGGCGLDDRAGFVALLYALDLLKDKKLCADVIVLGSSGEERNSYGAITSTYTQHPDYAIAVDVTHATSPDVPKTKGFDAGSGACITKGTSLNRTFTELIISVAKKNKIPHTIEVASGATGTNITPMQVVRFGTATGLVSLPLRYMHSPVEVVKTEDIESVGRLLAETISEMFEVSE